MAISLELLTDEAILDYTRGEGRDRVLYDHRDINLKYTQVKPIPGGVYDVEIFGSPFADQCICGRIQQPSLEPCRERTPCATLDRHPPTARRPRRVHT